MHTPEQGSSRNQLRLRAVQPVVANTADVPQEQLATVADIVWQVGVDCCSPLQGLVVSPATTRQGLLRCDRWSGDWDA
jgi:hypothetical protein